MIELQIPKTIEAGIRFLNKNTLAGMLEDAKSLGHNLKEWTYKTPATIAIGGVSGRGQYVYMDRLEVYAEWGWLIKKTVKKRLTLLKASDHLQEYAAQFENPYPYFEEAMRDEKEKYEKIKNARNTRRTLPVL